MKQESPKNNSGFLNNPMNRIFILLEEINDKIKLSGERMDSMNEKLDRNLDHIDGRFGTTDRQLHTIDRRLVVIETKLIHIEKLADWITILENATAQ